MAVAASAGALCRRLRATDASDRQWMQRMRAFVFDIDGVIHNGGKEIAGAAEALASLRASGRQVLFLTNNATKSPEDVVNLFATFGAVAKPDEVMTSAVAAADFLRKQSAAGHLAGKKVYVVGMNALENVVRQAGTGGSQLDTFGGEADASKGREEVVQEFLPSLDPPPEEVGAVVVGADFRFNYYKLTRAANYLRSNPSCLYVATNPDPRALLGPGVMVPAAGSMVAAVSMASGREPDIVCGKPSATLAQHILQSRGLSPESTCMVGDRMDTDVAFGRAGGMQTLLVESGSLTPEEAAAEISAAGESLQPHYIAPSIAVLSELLR